MIELRMLGTLDLKGADGRAVRSILAQPKRLALLAYLAVHPAGARRDSVVALFWPELDTAHARGALRQSLRFLRRELGDGDRKSTRLNSSHEWISYAVFCLKKKKKKKHINIQYSEYRL